MNKFEIGDNIVCIKKYETLKPGYIYSIKGSGNLTMNSATNKMGLGYYIEDLIPKYKSANYGARYKQYYFTKQEMDEYFTDDYKAYLRDRKINKIIGN